MFSGSRTWKPYADGGWDSYDNYTFSDANQRGARIYGWATLRFLCAVNGITPPTRRLEGDPFVPSTEILVRAVWEQLDNQRHLIDLESEPHVYHDTSDGGQPSIETLSEPAREFWRHLQRLHDDAAEAVNDDGARRNLTHPSRTLSVGAPGFRCRGQRGAIRRGTHRPSSPVDSDIAASSSPAG